MRFTRPLFGVIALCTLVSPQRAAAQEFPPQEAGRPSLRWTMSIGKEAYDPYDPSRPPGVHAVLGVEIMRHTKPATDSGFEFRIGGPLGAGFHFMVSVSVVRIDELQQIIERGAKDQRDVHQAARWRVIVRRLSIVVLDGPNFLRLPRDGSSNSRAPLRVRSQNGANERRIAAVHRGRLGADCTRKTQQGE